MGEKQTAFFYDSGGADNAFAPVSGAYATVGCSCRWTACVYENAVVFVGQNHEGWGGVWRISDAGAEPERISTPAVDKALAEAFKISVFEDFSAYVYDEDGHRFYVLNMPTGSWAFEAGVGWHERSRLNPSTGLLERIRQDFSTHWQGKHRCGAYDSGIVYSQSKDLYVDDGDPLLRRRETAHFSVEGKSVRIDRLWLDLEVGVGLDGGGVGSDPQVMLQVSIDGGRSFSNEILSTSLGAIGATRTRVQFGPLGRATDWVFRIGVSDPVPVVMLAAFAEVRVGR
jgi:hypothetical protein